MLFRRRGIFIILVTCTIIGVLLWYQFIKIHIVGEGNTTFIYTLLMLFVLRWFSLCLLDKYPSNEINPIADASTHIDEYDKDSNLVVIYNRIPKTGSTSFINLAYEMCRKNHYRVVHINVTANMHMLSLPNQLQFVKNISTWTSIKPALYHGHIAFIDFSKYGVSPKPLYINLIRKPLDRLVSYYYFLRYGDNFRPNLIRKKAGDTVVSRNNSGVV